MFRKIFNKGGNRQSFMPPNDVDSAGREAGESALVSSDRPNTAPFEWQRIYDGGDKHYSIAIGTLKQTDDIVCAIRWNGDNNVEGTKTVAYTGTPFAPNDGRWFVMPELLWDSTIEVCERLTRNGILTLKTNKKS